MSLSGQPPDHEAYLTKTHHHDQHPIRPGTYSLARTHSQREVSFSSYLEVSLTYLILGSPETPSATPHFLLLILSRSRS